MKSENYMFFKGLRPFLRNICGNLQENESICRLRAAIRNMKIEQQPLRTKSAIIQYATPKDGVDNSLYSLEAKIN